MSYFWLKKEDYTELDKRWTRKIKITQLEREIFEIEREIESIKKEDSELLEKNETYAMDIIIDNSNKSEKLETKLTRIKNELSAITNELDSEEHGKLLKKITLSTPEEVQKIFNTTEEPWKKADKTPLSEKW